VLAVRVLDKFTDKFWIKLTDAAAQDGKDI
jgi:hypothetical protein